MVNQFGDQALFISTSKYHHHIGLNTWNGVGAPPQPVNSVGLDFFTLILPNAQARDLVVTSLKSIGAPVTIENGVFITSDPSGNRIHLEI